MPGRLAITVCATEKYQYAMRSQARAIHANLRHYSDPIAIILVGDDGLKEIAKYYEELFGKKAEVRKIATFRQSQGGENYQHQAQLLIGAMRTAAFTAARAWDADLCWSLDSDVIPKSAMCFRTLEWVLAMPGNVYEVAISPYPSQGGGDFLAGRGTPQRPIAQDFTEAERSVPQGLLDGKADLQKKISEYRGPNPPNELFAEMSRIEKQIGECPPKGNVFKVNGEFGWRRRGWLSNAYPGLGRGSIVPTDWCGFGSTLLSRRALDECDFLGYDGGGTEDLWVCWWRWNQSGIRIGAALHEPSFHVSRRNDGKHFASLVRFVVDQDEDKGETTGHLRTVHKPFYDFEAGVRWDKDNDGLPMSPGDRAIQFQAQALKEDSEPQGDKKEPLPGS